jgi:hypothetical protein
VLASGSKNSPVAAPAVAAAKATAPAKVPSDKSAPTMR